MKKQKQLSKKQSLVLESSANSSWNAANQQAPVLKYRQFGLITGKHKNEKIDAYYKMREQDKALQKLCNYEIEHGLNNDMVLEFIDRKNECILDIMRLLRELGLPSDNLNAFIRERNITSLKIA